VIKSKFENGKEFKEGLDRTISSMAQSKGNIVDVGEMLPKTEVADSDLKALYDALYKAKLEEDTDKMGIILEEIEKIEEIDYSVIERELTERAIAEFLKKFE